MGNSIILQLRIPQSENPAKAFSLLLGTTQRSDPAQYHTPQKLLVLCANPDQFGHFRQLLMRVKVIDKKAKWAFGDGHLVVLGGGLCDEGALIEYLWFIYGLYCQAMLAGGRLHFLPGLRELQAMDGPWRHHHPQYAHTGRGRISVNALYDGNQTLWYWLRSRNFIIKIGRLLITQCGVPPRFDQLDLSLPSLNKNGRLHYSPANLSDRNAPWTTFFESNHNPFLFPEYTSGHITDAQFNSMLKRYRVDRMITASPLLGEETAFYRKRLLNLGSGLRVDNPEAIVFVRNQLYTIGLTGSRRILE